MGDWLRRLRAFNPVLVRGVIGLSVAGLLIWGVDLTPLGDKLQATTDVVGAIIALLSQVWVREAVTPAAAVVARVEDPLADPEQAVVIAGGYNVRAPGRVVMPYETLAEVTGMTGRDLHRDVVSEP